MKKLGGYIFVLLATFFWATLGVFIKQLDASGLDSMHITLLRSLFSCLAIAVFILIKDRSLFKINLRDIWLFLGSGILSFFLFTISYSLCVKYSGMSVASVLCYTAPAFVTVMSCIFFHERFTVKKLGALVLALLGCACVSGIFSSGGDETFSALGIFCGMLSGFTYALYSIFSALALKKYNPLTITFYTFTISCIVALFTCDPVGAFSLIKTPATALWAVGLGVIACATPYFLYTYALSFDAVEPSKASVMATIEPVFAALIGIFFFSESSDIFTVLGIILILAASALINLKRRED